MNKKDDVTENNHSFGQAAKHIKDAAVEVFAIFKDMKEVVLKEEQGSIQGYLEKISKDIDGQIISFEKTNGRYVSGELRLIYDEPEFFHVDVDLYFITSDQKWVKKQIPSKKNKLEWFFTPDEASKIMANKIFVFEYDSPKR